MANQHKPAKVLHIALWVAQLTVASSFAWAAWMKIFQPIEHLSAMWPWTGQIPTILVKITGLVDLLGALGLILPGLLRLNPQLTPITACCIIVLMLCAGIFHIVRGEAAVIGANLFFALLALFIA